MNSRNIRDADSIAQTRQILIDLRRQSPNDLQTYVIDFALSYPDPYNFLNDSCDIQSLRKALPHLRGEQLSEFRKAYSYEIEYIEDTILRDPDYGTFFAIEHMAI